MIDLHSRLLAVREEVSAGMHAHSAVCAALGQVDSAAGFVLCDLMHRWPLAAGRAGFPVPPVDARCSASARILAYQQASAFGTMWDENTQYGRNRRALLDWLIEETRP